ncbi:hypothetical protein GCM10010109_04850 [Actinoplanes campanulatus]|nr:hypothetical protein GCM10010109_04850 [Actinoplanes campanulatus]GID33981.1 hypothetical protein Aca09nite_04870 [Actinoplanes campanulatus]
MSWSPTWHMAVVAARTGSSVCGHHVFGHLAVCARLGTSGRLAGESVTTPLRVTERLGGRDRRQTGVVATGRARPATDLRPAGAAQAGAGSKRAPAGRDGPDPAGRGHAYKKGS